ncbi:methylated-DNA--[protein]-cysteine S-methyltransferase [bacterium]|nr:methylated-DNA--[protein]-cysteine S-methyltransferase [bacterium]
MLIGSALDSICWISFIDSQESSPELAIHENYPGATLIPMLPLEAPFSDPINQILDGGASDDIVPLVVHGTDFQYQVWTALCDIPAGETVSYQDIATRLGKPTAARAVATAIGSNPISLLVPCHRVVGKDGQLRGYRWGIDTKKKLLALESQYTTK